MTVLAKLSILLLFFRVFATTRRFRIWIYVGIITTTINHGNGFVLNCESILPSASESCICTCFIELTSFHPTVTLCATSDMNYSQCAHKTRTLTLAVSVCNILNDFFILLLPLLVISQLQMRYKKKVGLLAVFLTGFG